MDNDDWIDLLLTVLAVPLALIVGALVFVLILGLHVTW